MQNFSFYTSSFNKEPLLNKMTVEKTLVTFQLLGLHNNDPTLLRIDNQQKVFLDLVLGDLLLPFKFSKILKTEIPLIPGEIRNIHFSQNAKSRMKQLLVQAKLIQDNDRVLECFYSVINYRTMEMSTIPSSTQQLGITVMTNHPINFTENVSNKVSAENPNDIQIIKIEPEDE